MASGYFTTAQNAYQRDWKTENAELQRQHEERRKRDELDARVARFIGRELYGQAFRSLEALEFAACRVAVLHQMRALSVEQHDAILRVTRALWGGILLRSDIEVPYTRMLGTLQIGEPSAECVA